MVHMPWRVFFLWNAAGGITWCASVIGLGYFFGHSLHAIEKVLGVGGVIAVVSVAVVGLVMWRRFEKAKLHELEDDGEIGAATSGAAGVRPPSAKRGRCARARPSSGSASATMSTASTCAHTRTSSVRSAATRSRALCDALSAP